MRLPSRPRFYTGCRPLTLRPRTRLGLAIRLALLALALYLLSYSCQQLGRLDLSTDLTWFDLGWYGFMPTRSYRSTRLTSPDLEFLARDARCSRDFYVFAPRGPAVGEKGGVILDHAGELVWRQAGFDGDTQDLRVQEYRGEKFLTFWVGTERDSQKKGVWYMMDETYTVRHQIYCTGGECDMHEFQITDAGTALMAVYNPVRADLSPIGGTSSGWILECRFQEVDIATGELLFEWIVSEHVPVEDTYRTLEHCTNDPFQVYDGCGNFQSSAFDFYHINSVQKDAAGNYLVSGRNTHSLLYIDGTSGEIIWHLGGRRNDFEDLSSGAATNFSWQHYARWLPDGGISLFDNTYDNWHSSQTPQSRAMILDLDITARTASLRKEYTHPARMRSQTQGNAQVLPSGNMFVGWGRSAAFSEFAEDGTLLCDAHFGASAFYSFGPVSSYRVFREAWTGRPSGPPSMVIEDGVVYVSWNGATEVATWQLEGEKEGWRVLAQVDKTGFETTIGMPRVEGYSSVRVSALDAKGDVLGSSDPRKWPSRRSWLASPLGTLTLQLVLSLTGIITAVAMIVFLWRRFGYIVPTTRWRRGAATYQPLWNEETLLRRHRA